MGDGSICLKIFSFFYFLLYVFYKVNCYFFYIFMLLWGFIYFELELSGQVKDYRLNYWKMCIKISFFYFLGVLCKIFGYSDIIG